MTQRILTTNTQVVYEYESGLRIKVLVDRHSSRFVAWYDTSTGQIPAPIDSEDLEHYINDAKRRISERSYGGCEININDADEPP